MSEFIPTRILKEVPGTANSSIELRHCFKMTRQQVELRPLRRIDPLNENIYKILRNGVFQSIMQAIL